MKTALIAVFAIIVMSMGLTSPSHAIDLNPNCSANLTAAECKLLKEDDLNKDKGSKNIVQQVIFAALGILGGIAVIMIVVGGIKFAVSGGDSAGVSSAKSTIMYAVIGLIVAVAGGLIVTTVVNFFG